MPVFNQKNVKSVKTTLYSGSKKSLGCPFFPILPAVMPIFDQKKRRICQNYFIFWVKKVCRITFFFRFLRTNHLSDVHSFSTTILDKTQCSQVHTLSKCVQSLKNNLVWCHFFKIFMKNPLLSSPYLVKKTSILLKLHYIMGPKSQQDILFSQFFTKSNCSHAHV